jgi:phosphoenolpyruvate carboxylase
MSEMDELVERRGARVPCAMATQHPDSASRYVSVQKEEAEALQCLAPSDGGLGCDEYMVDYEGKLTPYHQVANIVIKLLDELNLVPGRDVFIIPRIPSAEKETIFRQYASILAAVEANYRTRHIGASVIEVIHPMTTTGAELVEVRRRIMAMEDIAKAAGSESQHRAIELIPLVEEVPPQLSVGKMLVEYTQGCERKLGVRIPYLRVFIGKSDSTMMYGHIPSVMSCKLAIADAYAFGAENGIPIAPMFGGGALPFRGHVTVENIQNVLREYRGTRTITVQSGIRYDHEPEKTKQLVKILRQELPKGRPLLYTEEQRQHMVLVCGVFAKHYISTLLRVAPAVKQLSDILPRQRDRLVRGGKAGYARWGPQTHQLAELCKPLAGGVELARQLVELKVEDLELPRAIGYTGSLYTACLPPEFMGTGRGLLELSQKNKDVFEALLREYYPSLPADLEFAGHFLDLKKAGHFLPQDVIRDVTEDINLIRELLGLEFEPDPSYSSMVSIVEPYLTIMRGKVETLPTMELAKLDPLARDLLSKLGKMRGSLG